MKELEVIQHSRIPGVTVFFNTVDYRTAHMHSEWELIWILRNPLQVISEQRRITVQKDDLLLFSPEQLHEFRKVEESVTFLCLQFSPAMLCTVTDRLFDGIVLGPFLSDSECETIRRQMAQIAQAYLEESETAPLLCLGRLYTLLHELFSRLPMQTVTPEERSSRSRQMKRITALMRFVDENYMHKIRLSDFAEAEHLSVSYLSHFIRRSMNCTFQQYVTDVRVNSACKQIAAGEGNMTDVSLDSGFSDYRYFSGAFKARFGMTPEQYRQTACRPQGAIVHHSIHSLERFYSLDRSRELAAELSAQ